MTIPRLKPTTDVDTCHSRSGNARGRSRRPAGRAARLLGGMALVMCWVTRASGGDLFTTDLTFDNTVAVRNGVNRLPEWQDLFGGSTLKELWPSYQPDSKVQARANLRGLPAFLTYDVANPSLNLTIPVLGINLTFAGQNREESKELLRAWLRGRVNGDKVVATRNQQLAAANSLLEAVLHGTVVYSAVEPLAGNPNSLQTRMTMADYAAATDVPLLSLRERTEGTAKPENLFRFNASYFGGDAGSFSVQGVELDFGGVINFSNPHWALLLDGPISFTWTEHSARTLMISFGVGGQYRVNDHWSLTAFARGGGVGSIDVGSMGFLYSADLSSYARWSLGKTQLGWGLLGGFNKSIDGLSIEGYNLSYNVTSFPLRTGLDWSVPLGCKLGKQPLDLQAFGIYTHFFGDEMYLQEQGEAGLALRLMKQRDMAIWQGSRLFASYVFGNHYSGFNAGLSFNF